MNERSQYEELGRALANGPLTADLGDIKLRATDEPSVEVQDGSHVVGQRVIAGGKTYEVTDIENIYYQYYNEITDETDGLSGITRYYSQVLTMREV
jgi:hypothetical protein